MNMHREIGKLEGGREKGGQRERGRARREGEERERGGTMREGERERRHRKVDIK